jgi:hypothetical protein
MRSMLVERRRPLLERRDFSIGTRTCFERPSMLELEA